MSSNLDTATDIQQGVAAKQISAEEVTGKFLKQIAAADSNIGAFLRVEEEHALNQARTIDKKVAQNEELGPLAGVPVAIKDNICIKGMPTSCASKMLEAYAPPYSAHIIDALIQADAVLIGKTNLDEFAMGSSTENSAYHTTKNPWDTACIPGGSSGGSAAAVAAGMAPIAVGSDTGGSIRQPASLCGVVGMKPTYGLVSRYGLVAFASSLDQIGPLSYTVKDAALLLGVLAEHDRRDSTNIPGKKKDYVGELEKRDLKKTIIGLPEEYFAEGLDPEVRTAVEAAIQCLRDHGAQFETVRLPHTKYAVAAYYIIAPSEASSNLARYDGVKFGHRTKEAGDLLAMYEKTRAEGFGPEVKRRIMLGTYALSSGYYEAYYGKAQAVRTLIRHDFDEAFNKVDCLLTPTTPTPAFKIGEKSSDPLAMYLSDVFTISCNLAGIPGISIPCGFSQKGLPIGMQLLGKPFDELTLLQVGHAYQQETNWHKKRPERQR